MDNQSTKNFEESNKKETFVSLVESFESSLKVYHELVKRESDIFKTVKNNEKEFFKIVEELIEKTKKVNEKIDNPEETKDVTNNRLSHLKIIFKHYDSFLEIQKKTAQTYIMLENQKTERKIPNIVGLREIYSKAEIKEDTNRPKV